MCVLGVWVSFVFPTSLCRIWHTCAAAVVSHQDSSLPPFKKGVDPDDWRQMFLLLAWSSPRTFLPRVWHCQPILDSIFLITSFHHYNYSVIYALVLPWSASTQLLTCKTQLYSPTLPFFSVACLSTLRRSNLQRTRIGSYLATHSQPTAVHWLSPLTQSTDSYMPPSSVSKSFQLLKIHPKDYSRNLT